MSTLQPIQTTNFSPILLSPSSTTLTTNPLTVFDNSDQGSVDSDYTSLGSSKFYGNSGSTSSLHRQGRSQSIDELAQNLTTNIPTRHFNGISSATKITSDPLQFVKIQPNHDLIERAQEQICLVESRKRLQDNYKLLNISNEKKFSNEDDVDWTKAVDSWKQKRELKRLKSDNSNSTINDRSISPLKIEPIIKSNGINKVNNEPIRSLPSPPVIKSKPKSPSPLRNRGPSKKREIFIEKPVDVRGFGFKLEDGRAQNRAIYISTIEEGSPADKAGLYIDDEVIAMNDDNIEQMTFDQVRKILKERNLRGTIKLTVKTYEDTTDDNSQTVVSAQTTDHSRTPSPQKHITCQTPVYEVVSHYTEPIKNQSIPSSSAVNIFAPKPYANHQESDLTFSRKELLTLMTTVMSNEKQQANISPSQTSTNIIVNPSIETIKQIRNESPIAQVRSLVEKQMDQLQQDLEFGFSRTPKSPPVPPPLPPPPIVREQKQSMTNISSCQEPLRSSLKKSFSTQNELDQIPTNRTYGLKINPNEQVIHYLDPYTQSRPLISQNKRSIPDLTTTTKTQTIERTFNELKINMPTSHSSQPQIVNQQQKKVTIQLGDKTPPLPQRTSSKHINHPTRKTHFENPTCNNNEQKKSTMYNYPMRNPSPTHRPKSPNRYNNDRVLSVSGRLHCSRCLEELGQGSAMVIESLGLYYHIECFRCCVCNIPLSSSFEGTDVRVRNNRLHCQNCFSDDNGAWKSNV